MTAAPALLRAELIVVRGEPAPQGSKSAFAIRKGGVYTGQVAVVEASRKRNRPWRAAVTEAAVETLAGRPPLEGPVGLRLTFTVRRPKTHYGTGRNAAMLRASAPARPGTRPDQDKLARAVADSLTTAGVYRDDGQVAECHVIKCYPLEPGQWAGTTGMVQVGEPTGLCGVPGADALEVPGVVIRAWQLDGSR